MNRQQLCYDLFQAYFDARRNKRNSGSALEFETDFEHRLFVLCDELSDGTYRPQPGSCFVTHKPVKREIYAPAFRDRIVHHLLYNRLYNFFDRQFIYDSYSCRKNKGTLFGVRRLDGFIRSCSRNYTADCYVLKLDILGYFMHINRELLLSQIDRLLEKMQVRGELADVEFTRKLVEQVLFQDVVSESRISGNPGAWKGLPPSKSLRNSPAGCGLPIGNLTSQLFSNVYLNALDRFVRYDLGVKYYGRYVDDFVLVHRDKAYLKSLIPLIGDFLSTTLGLTLHPRKMYLQHYTKGVEFLGCFILPGRIYPGRRVTANFTALIRRSDIALKREGIAHWQSRINSYLGTLRHSDSFNLRHKYLKQMMCMSVGKFGYVVDCEKFVTYKSVLYGNV